MARLLLLLALVAASCGAQSTPVAPPAATTPTAAGTASLAWLEIELRDVLTGQTFRLSDFAGQPVVVETMAVWCPTCVRQQQQLALARRSWGEAVVVVSLDIDPAEDEELLREHATGHGFDWRWAVAPRQMASQLSDLFGPRILSPPQTPVFWIDVEGEPHFLGYGVKLWPKLVEEVAPD